jgi:RNA polymerase sigma factor (sigma-70 family)
MASPPLPSVLVALGANASSAEPDGELLARFVASGDDAAFTHLVRRYARLVWRVARTRCRSESNAEDVFQATFVVLARKASSVRSAAALPGWLHRTAHRLAVRAARRERPSPPLPSDTAVSADPLDALTARELLAAVDDEMAKLSDAERSVLVLCGVENQSLDEAATRLGCTVGAVKGRLERSRAKLRQRLDARGLTLPAVGLTVLARPPARAVEAAVTHTGGPVPPAVEQLLSGGTHMTRRFVALGLVAVLVAGGVGTGFGLLPHDVPAAAVAAPVPKEKASPVVWSEPVKVDWQASRAERLGGVWTPDGKGVLVPSPTVVEQDEKVDFGGVDVRDADTGKVTKRLAFKPNGKVDQMFLPQSLAVSPDGKTVYASGSLFAPGGKGEAARGVVTWKDVNKDAPPQVAVSADPPESPILLSPDGKQLINLAGRAVEVSEVGSGKLVWSSRFGDNAGRPTALAFHPSEGNVVVGGTGGGYVGLDASNGRTMFSVTKLGLDVGAVTVSPDGEFTAVGGSRLAEGRALIVLGKDTPADAVAEKVSIHGLAFSPDGKHLLAACSDGEVRVFEPKTGKQVTSAKEHKGDVFGVAFSPDGKRLLTVGRDAVKVWDVERLLKVK